MRWIIVASFLGGLGCAAPAVAQSAGAAVPPLRQQAAVQDAWLAKRLDMVVPRLMRENSVDMWVLVAREYLEDPVVATMLDARSIHARRRTILVFFDPGGGKPVERLTVSRYGLGGLFAPAWEPEKQPDQWRGLAELIAARNPKTIAVNSSALTAFGDGLTLSQHQEMMAALPAQFRARVRPTHKLAVGWLETRIPEELPFYRRLVGLAHNIIAEAFSRKVITPGRTTAEDVVWWYRDKVSDLGLSVWFQPSIGIQRPGATGMLSGDTVIRPGDLLWTDFGITAMRLNTDTQQLAYVLKDGEKDAPSGLKRGLLAANRVADALTASFKTGRSGNEILALARAEALRRGLKPSIYSHPIGYHGHGAGPAIGFWDNQGRSETGELPLRADTAWSIELSARERVPEWGGQEVEFRSEEDAYFDGVRVTYLDGRQTKLHLIGRR